MDVLKEHCAGESYVNGISAVLFTVLGETKHFFFSYRAKFQIKVLIRQVFSDKVNHTTDITVVEPAERVNRVASVMIDALCMIVPTLAKPSRTHHLVMNVDISLISIEAVPRHAVLSPQRCVMYEVCMQPGSALALPTEHCTI